MAARCTGVAYVHVGRRPDECLRALDYPVADGALVGLVGVISTVAGPQ